MIFRKLTAVLLALMLLALMLLAGMTSVFPATAAAAQTDDGFVGATSGKTGSFCSMRTDCSIPEAFYD